MYFTKGRDKKPVGWIHRKLKKIRTMSQKKDQGVSVPLRREASKWFVVVQRHRQALTSQPSSIGSRARKM